MKLAKRIMAVLCTFAIAVCFMQIPTIDVQAAGEPKSHTYVQDAVTGVGYPAAVRVEKDSRYGYFSVYLKNQGDYVAGVKSNNKKLITKVTYKNVFIDENSYFAESDYFDEAEFKGMSRVTCFSQKAGTYKVTLTIKNAANSVIGKVNVKVIVGAEPQFEKITFNGKDIASSYIPSNNLTKKSSGKLVVKCGKGYQVKQIQVGGYNPDGTINYTTVKSGAKIQLSDIKSYTEVENDSSSEWYTSVTENKYDYIYPKTTVKITIYDKKLKITYDVYRYIYKQV